MEIVIRHKILSSKSTIGDLFIDGNRFCFTLEDVYRGLRQDMDLGTIKRIKQAGVTAIPTGTYKVKLTMSNRFKKVLPEILNVPGYSGVRIHAGNTDADTEGCILVGNTNPSKDFVGGSQDAIRSLLAILQGQDNISIQII